MFSEEHLYAIALRRCNLIGDINFHKLVSVAGSAKEVWELSKNKLNKIDGIGKKISLDIGNIEHLKFAENELKFCEKHNVKIRLRHLNELPKLLNECVDAPAILYQKGNFPENLQNISMVGTRNLTNYGKTFIQEFFKEINPNNVISVSGLALGADTEVHEQSLQNNIPTVAVLAHGFHLLYPTKNKKLSERILEGNGALITEFNSSHKPDRENFIQRNRIIAGLSATTIVVETAFGGGSISTVTFANNYNREVFALPGKITDKYSQGCNLVIAQNKANTISTIKSLIENLNLDAAAGKMEELFPTSEIFLQLPENHQIILDIIIKNPQITLDEISQKSGILSFKILPILLDLEISGLVKSLSGRQYLAK